MYGSVRGAISDDRPYRDQQSTPAFRVAPCYLTVLLSGSHAYNFQGIDCSDRHEYLPVANEEIPVEGGYDAQFR
jgi:hypothetical protein